jgi:hypothetical protein
MLRQALAPVLGDSGSASARLEAAGVAPTARGEELSVADFLRIARPSGTPDDREVLAATGRHPDEWFAFLDAQGATGWDRARIEGWISTSLSDPGAWPGLIAGRYERARGMR